MKVLHIGEKGNLAHYCGQDPYYKTLDVVDLPSGLADEEYLSQGRNADVIVVDAISPVSGYLVGQMPRLKMIHSEGVAYNTIDVEEASRRGICVCNSQGMNATAVAEQALLLMLAMIKDLVRGDRAVRNGHQIEVKTGEK